MVLSSEAANASLQGGLPEPRLFDAGTPAQLMRGKPVAQPMRALSGRAAAWYAGLDILALQLQLLLKVSLAGRSLVSAPPS